MPKKPARIWEFGDYQTPPALAAEAVASLRRHLSFKPGTIIEPTCGVGNFLLAAADAFPDARQLIALDIEESYLRVLRERIGSRYAGKLEIICGDFFTTDWSSILAQAPGPILVIGNPPWVTNADVGLLNGSNLPAKSNFQNRSGLDALTGKANFDISEWMLVQHMDWLREHKGCVAVLCKTAVARKVLLHVWRRDIPAIESRMVQIDAMRHFNAAVDACFFVAESQHDRAATDCKYYGAFGSRSPSRIIGYHQGMMLSDVRQFSRLRHLIGHDTNYVWRSGIKHDCSKVMELTSEAEGLRNGFGEAVSIEERYLFPLLKSSDLGNGRIGGARLKVIVTQTRVGEETDRIRRTAPRTFDYLAAYASLLDRRKSRIYKDKPKFSIFGIGPYAFAPWKVAISGFYKKLDFKVVGPVDGKPTMLDDTSYFLSCASQAEAMFLARLLNAKDAQALLSSMTFWSDKRPITIELLKRLHIGKLAKHLGRGRDCRRFAAERHAAPLFAHAGDATMP